jgi:hypothetical protein
MQTDWLRPCEEYFRQRNSEADIIPYMGGLTRKFRRNNLPASYPKPYTITVGGKGIDREVDADMK